MAREAIKLAASVGRRRAVFLSKGWKESNPTPSFSAFKPVKVTTCQ